MSAVRARLKAKSRALALQHASDDLRKDRKLVITAMLNHPGALVYCLDEDLKNELRGLSRAQLEVLLETADEDMAASQKDAKKPAVDAPTMSPSNQKLLNQKKKQLKARGQHHLRDSRPNMLNDEPPAETELMDKPAVVKPSSEPRSLDASMDPVKADTSSDSEDDVADIAMRKALRQKMCNEKDNSWLVGDTSWLLELDDEEVRDSMGTESDINQTMCIDSKQEALPTDQQDVVNRIC